MMTFDYYVQGREANNSHPLLEFAEFGPLETALIRCEPIPATAHPIPLRLGAPVPRAPQMVDYHSLPLPVVSDKIGRAVEALHLPDVQLVPALVKTPAKSFPYWILHVRNIIPCIDRRTSMLSDDEDDGQVMGIKRLVLDERALDEVPPERRMLFRLAEYIGVHVFSGPVRDAILATSPEGIRFWPANGWGESAAFR